MPERRRADCLQALEQDNLNTVFMNWIILILAGLMEVGFTFCLGKTKTVAGQEQAWWWAGFLVSLSLSMYLMAKAAERLPIGTVYPVWTGIGVGWRRHCRHSVFQRTGHILAHILHHHAHPLDNRTQSIGMNVDYVAEIM